MREKDVLLNEQYFVENKTDYEACIRVAPKLMPPILLCWPTTSEADVGNMAVEVEPFRQYSIKFCLPCER